MDKNRKTGLRYGAEEQAAVVRMVRTLCGLNSRQSGEQLTGYHCNLVMGWSLFFRGSASQTLTMGYCGVTCDGLEEIRRLGQENRELKRANKILKRAGSFFGAELDRQQKN